MGFIICHWSLTICHFQEIADFAETLNLFLFQTRESDITKYNSRSLGPWIR